MKATMVGIEKVDYFSKKNNKQVKGISVHYTCKTPNVDGLYAGTEWVTCESKLYNELTLRQVKEGGMPIDIIKETPPGGRYAVLTEIKFLA